MTEIVNVEDREGAKLGIEISVSYHDIDYVALGRWFAGQNSEDQANFIEGLADELFRSGGNSGEMQIAYLADDLHRGRSLGSTVNIERFIRSLYAHTEGDNNA